MLLFLLISLPIFAVIAIGWAVGRRGLLDATAVNALNWFAFTVAMPALMVRVIARQPADALLNLPFLLGVAIVAAVLFVAALALSLRFETGNLAVAASRGQAVTIGNLGFLGIPLLIAFLGERVAAPIAIVSIVDLVLVIPLAIGLMQAARGEGGARSRLLGLLRGAFLNPFLLSVVAGLALALSGLALPEPIDRFLGFLGAAAGPTALFALGVSLAQWRVNSGTVVTLVLTATKLVLHPILMFVVLALMLRLDPFWVQAGVLFAALPIAGNVYVIAARHEAGPEPIAAAILATTAIAALTFPLTAWLLGI